MSNTLYTKLAVVLLALFAAIGIAFLLLARFSTDMYYQEVTQQLNSEIAMYIVAEQPLIRDGQVNRDGLKALATQVMIVNPSVEVFLLDPEGRILDHALPDEAVVRDQIDLAPIQRFIQGTDTLPIMGDDPRSPEKRKIFSAAVVEDEGIVEGYLYTILGGANYDSVSELFRTSYIRRLSVWAIGAILLFAFLAALIVFAVLTRRLRFLTRAVETFSLGRANGLTEVTTPASGGDEIDRLGRSFGDMATRIGQQVEQIERTDHMRRELMTNISHDLRTPLASMRGYIETLLIKNDELSPEDRLKYLQIADKHATRASMP